MRSLLVLRTTMPSKCLTCCKQFVSIFLLLYTILKAPFSQLLDLPSLDSTFRSPFMNALLRLSSKSGLYPAVLVQNDVILDSQRTLASGGFANVWKGTLHGQPVAVKVLRTSDLVERFKVCWLMAFVFHAQLLKNFHRKPFTRR